jgi:hypothetical protein
MIVNTERGGDDIVTEGTPSTSLPQYNAVLQTIVSDFSLSSELLVSGLITSKGCSTCRMGVSSDTLPETLYLPRRARLIGKGTLQHGRQNIFPVIVGLSASYCITGASEPRRRNDKISLRNMHINIFRRCEGGNSLRGTQHFSSLYVPHSMIRYVWT